MGTFLKFYNLHFPHLSNGHDDNKTYFAGYLGGCTEKATQKDTFSKGPPREKTINMMKI